MTSQFLAVYYLSKLQHYMFHDLHLTFINYMNDYIILHQDKEYLKYCRDIIKEKLEKEYDLKINNRKTYIASIKKGIKRGKYYYQIGKITFAQYFFQVLKIISIVIFM